MTVTFDPALGDDVSKVRQRIGDTDQAKGQLQDETIQAYLTTGMSVLATAQRCCYDLAARWAAAGDVMLDDQRTMASHIYQHYIDLAAKIALEMAPITTEAQAAGGAILVTGCDEPRRDCGWW